MRTTNRFTAPRNREGWKRLLLGLTSLWEEAITIQLKRAKNPPGSSGREYAIDMAFLIMTAHRLHEVGLRGIKELGLDSGLLSDFDSAQPDVSDMRHLLEHAIPSKSDGPAMEGLGFQPGTVVDIQPDGKVLTVIDADALAGDALKMAAQIRNAINSAP